MHHFLRFFAALASVAVAIVVAAPAAHAQSAAAGRGVLAADVCHVTGTVRQFRDNEFSPYRAKPALAGSVGLGCELYEIKGMPLGTSLGIGVYGEVLEVAPFKRQSGYSGDMLTKHMGTMAFVGGSAELKLPTFGRVTPSLLVRYGIEVGSVFLPRGFYTDANGWERVFAKRYTNEIGVAGCLDYQRAVKVCAEFAKMVYDSYPHAWVDPQGKLQGRPEEITAANEIVGRVIVPFSSLHR